MAEYFPLKSSWCRNEQFCLGMKLINAFSGLPEWVPQYIRTYLYVLLIRTAALISCDALFWDSLFKDDKTEENTFEILQHSDRNINNS